MIGLDVAFGLSATSSIGLAAAVAVIGLAAALFCLAALLFFLPTAFLGFFPRCLAFSWVGIVFGGSCLFLLFSASACFLLQ